VTGRGRAARQLIITADDFGMSREVNEAVEEAHRTGCSRRQASSSPGMRRQTPSSVRDECRLSVWGCISR
jgi:hypothetical protein